MVIRVFSKSLNLEDAMGNWYVLTSAPFLRKATGLVREAGMVDVFNIAVLNLQPAFAIMYLLMSGPSMYPGGDLILATAICLVGSVFMALTWAMMAGVIPRSGGDYVFISRSIHPLIGFLSSLCWVIAQFFWIGQFPVWVANPGLSSMFIMLGNADLGSWFSSTMGMIIVGLIVLWGSYLLLCLHPRYWRRYFVILTVLGFIQVIIVYALVMPASHADVVAAFNAYSARFGSADYNTVLSLGADSLKANYQATLGQTLNLIPIASWGLVYAYFAAYVAGEVKSVHRNYLVALPASVIVTGVLMMSSAWLFIQKYGYDFLYSIVYVANNVPAQYALPAVPRYDVLAMTLTNNPLVIVLIGVGWLAWALNQPIIIFLGLSRIGLAWSFDRVAPAFMGDVDERYHSPIKSMTVFAIYGTVGLFVFVLPMTASIIASFAPFLIQASTTFVMVAIAAIVLPIRKSTRHIYESAPISKYKILGVPVLSAVAIPYLVFYLGLIYYAWTRPELGYVQIPSLIGVLIGLICGALAFGWVWNYRKRHGIDIGAVYREIPVE